MRKALKPGESRAVQLAAVEYRCTRCDHVGVALPEPIQEAAPPPKRCANCRSPYWMDAKGVRPLGRPPKPKPVDVRDVGWRPASGSKVEPWVLVEGRRRKTTKARRR